MSNTIIVLFVNKFKHIQSKRLIVLTCDKSYKDSKIKVVGESKVIKEKIIIRSSTYLFFSFKIYLTSCFDCEYILAYTKPKFYCPKIDAGVKVIREKNTSL